MSHQIQSYINRVNLTKELHKVMKTTRHSGVMIEHTPEGFKVRSLNLCLTTLDAAEEAIDTGIKRSIGDSIGRVAR